MNLTALSNQKTIFSLEVFPPKKSTPDSAILDTISHFKAVDPDFISVTLGAGGTNPLGGNIEVADIIQNQLGIDAVAHVPGLYQTKSEVLQLLDKLDEINVHNILALRGDRIANRKPVGEFNHANELVEFIKSNRPKFNILGACYPNCHTDADSFIDDIANLKVKVDSGADHLITQLFFDDDAFYEFYEKARIAGINVPIEAGIMPCTNKRQIERITSITGVPVPKKFQAILDRYADNKEAMRDAGIAFAVDQIIDLVSRGVDGIHLYTMNQADTATRIYNETKSVFKATEVH